MQDKARFLLGAFFLFAKKAPSSAPSGSRIVVGGNSFLLSPRAKTFLASFSRKKF